MLDMRNHVDSFETIMLVVSFWHQQPVGGARGCARGNGAGDMDITSMDPDWVLSRPDLWHLAIRPSPPVLVPRRGPRGDFHPLPLGPLAPWDLPLIPTPAAPEPHAFAEFPQLPLTAQEQHVETQQDASNAEENNDDEQCGDAAWQEASDGPNADVEQCGDAPWQDVWHTPYDVYDFPGGRSRISLDQEENAAQGRSHAYIEKTVFWAPTSRADPRVQARAARLRRERDLQATGSSQ